MTEDEAQSAVVTLLRYIGEDTGRDGLLDTPGRVVRALDEMSCGYGQDPAKILSADFDGNGYDQMIVCRGIEFSSICEHHLLPFLGVAHVGYIPAARVVGLSKMPRLVECFARRLQLQEKLTQQIAQAMEDNLKPKGVAVVIAAKHLCMSCRGVRKNTAEMVTTCLLGAFKEHKVREEFLWQCKA